MNNVKSIVTIFVIGGIALSFAKNPKYIPQIISAGADGFALLYRTASGTDFEQRRKAV